MVRLLRTTWAGLAVAAALSAGTAARAAGETGPYTLAAADGQVICRLSLDTEPMTAAGQDGAAPTPGKVTVDPGCAATFADLGSVTGWLHEGGAQITLVNASGEPVVIFQDIGGGIRVGRFDAGGIAYLANDREAVAAGDAPSGGAGGPGITGDWTVARGSDGGTPLCTVTLSDAPAGDGLAMLTPNEGCGEAIRVLDLAGWKLAGGTLSVHDATGRMRLSFTQQDGPVWIRDPGGSRPLFLIRGE